VNGLVTLWRRELAAYFLSPVAYVVAVVFLVILGFDYFLAVDLNINQRVTIAEINGELLSSPLFFWPIFLVLVPVLTMRVLAEEKRSGTIETLMTAPVTDTAVVLAKYLAAVAFFCAIWAPTLSYPFLLRRFSAEAAPLDLGALAGGYAGVLLLAMFYLALGILCSSLTRSQLVAAVSCFALMCLAFYLGLLHYYTHLDWLRELSAYASGVLHQMTFTRGMLDSRPLVLYGSGTVLILFAAVRIQEARRW
jgi:ABC-2 type transport system permease protein